MGSVLAREIPQRSWGAILWCRRTCSDPGSSGDREAGGVSRTWGQALNDPSRRRTLGRLTGTRVRDHRLRRARSVRRYNPQGHRERDMVLRSHALETSTRPRALFISATVPWLLGSGSTRRVEATLGALLRTYDVDLIAPAPPSRHQIPHGVSVLALNRGRTKKTSRHSVRSRAAIWLKWVTRPSMPIDAFHIWSPSPRQLRAVTAGNEYDIVWVFRAELAACVYPSLADRAMIVDADDDEIEKLDARLKEDVNVLQRAFRRDQRRRYRAVYRRLSRMGAVLCLAKPPDQARPGIEFMVVRNGLSDPGFIPPGVRSPEPSTAAFLGQMRYEPNREAALEAVSDVLPRLQAIKPETQLVVIGESDLDTKLQLELAGARVMGFVPDLVEALTGVTALVLPVRRGSGTSIKVIEALARGVPIISTAFGVRGLALVPGVHYLEADSPADFAGAWVELTSGYPARAEALARAGRRLYQASFSCEAVASDVQEVASKLKGDASAATRRNSTRGAFRKQ